MILPRIQPNTIRLYLCRHGQTVANSQKLIQGAGINSPLTTLGQQQATNLSKAFQQINLSRIISSNLIRAQSTAKPLLSMGQTVEINKELREMEYGSLEGLAITDDDTMSKMRNLWQNWRDELNTSCPGNKGESMQSLINRAENVLWNIAQNSTHLTSPHVAIVSHSMFLRAIIAKFELAKDNKDSTMDSHLFMKGMDEVQLANSSITVVDFDTSNNELNIRPTPKVLVIGSTEHIQEELLIDDTSKSIGMSGSGVVVGVGPSSSSSPSTSHRRINQLQRHLSTTSGAPKSIVVGSDHGGYDLKIQIVEHLKTKGYQVHDVGCHQPERCDYPDIAELAGQATIDALNTHQRGIVVCGSGIGISIAANKVPGVRCALLHDHYGAVMCRKHNNANMIALGGRTTGIEIAKEIVDAFLSTEFEGGRHAERVDKIE